MVIIRHIFLSTLITLVAYLPLSAGPLLIVTTGEEPQDLQSSLSLIYNNDLHVKLWSRTELTGTTASLAQVSSAMSILVASNIPLSPCHSPGDHWLCYKIVLPVPALKKPTQWSISIHDDEGDDKLIIHRIAATIYPPSVFAPLISFSKDYELILSGELRSLMAFFKANAIKFQRYSASRSYNSGKQQLFILKPDESDRAPMDWLSERQMLMLVHDEELFPYVAFASFSDGYRADVSLNIFSDISSELRNQMILQDIILELIHKSKAQ